MTTKHFLRDAAGVCEVVEKEEVVVVFDDVSRAPTKFQHLGGNNCYFEDVTLRAVRDLLSRMKGSDQCRKELVGVLTAELETWGFENHEPGYVEVFIVREGDPTIRVWTDSVRDCFAKRYREFGPPGQEVTFGWEIAAHERDKRSPH